MIDIVGASLVFICNRDFSIIENGAIAFERGNDSILAVGDYNALCATYKGADKAFYDNSILLPAFINAHIHFEFGAHVAEFCYGDFGAWLDSLMARRESVLDMGESIIERGIQAQLDAGVGSVGAISSYGNDAKTLAKSPLRVVYFNEAIGSNENALDSIYDNFIKRLDSSKDLESSTFTPAIALHSPYSLHPNLAKKLIDIALNDNLLLSAHFLESKQEREWLDSSSGYFKGFFNHLGNKEARALYSAKSFLDMLLPLQNRTLSLTHCLQLAKSELESIKRLNASIITSPRSNRLLNNAYLALDSISDVNIAIGTDGNSSNYSVNMLEELKIALFAYPKQDLLSLAKRLILCATHNGAKALGLNNGTLAVGKSVDIALFGFTKPLNANNQAPLHFILHATKPQALYICAKQVI